MELALSHLAICLLLLPALVLSYDPVDLEIYDLVEEVGIQNSFYQTLQVDKAASVAEIRRAYRKLSLVLHPDKNDSPDAEGKFRQLVAIYEILKDTEKRKKYDQVLKDGLPDWRQPIYYYRKVKKMGLTELAVLLLVVLTIGHYIVSWAVYLEKAFELEEIMAPIKKKREKKRARGKIAEDEIDTASTSYILEENYGYKKPSFTNLLPFLLYRWTISFITSIPSKARDMRQQYEDYKERKRLEQEEEEESEEEEEVKPRPKKQPVKLRDASEFEHEMPFASTRNVTNTDGEPASNQTDKANTDWTEDDLAALARAVAKFPGGIPGRWDRIALEIGRTVSEVTKKVKEMKTSLSSSGVVLPGGAQTASGVVGKRAAFQISDNIITKAIESELNPKPEALTVTPEDLYTTQDEIPEDYDLGVSYDQQDDDDDIEQYRQVRKRKVKTRPDQVEPEKPEESSEVQPEDAEEPKKSIKNDKENEKKIDSASDVWSQVQQKCLETALSHVPKNRTDRWTHIARSVPGKTKEECLKRYKLLVEHIKKKKDPENLNEAKTPKKVD